MKILNARKTLVSSIIAVIISFSILIGNTFAWFTDVSASGINKIESGNLDVGLTYTNSWNGQEQEVNENTAIFTDINGDPILWEPGAFASGRFEVANNGMLALKYELAILQANATQTPDGKTLADALTIYALTRNKVTGTDDVMADARLEALQIDAAVPEYDPQNMCSFKDGFALEAYLLPGESITYEIGLFWEPTENDNDFNVAGGLSLDFAVSLRATQATYETDGDGFIYDLGAQLPGQITIPSIWNGTVDTSWYNDTETTFSLSSAEALAGFAELVDEGNTFEGKTIKLECDIDLANILFDPIGSYRFDTSFKGTFDGQKHIISNLSQNTWELDNGYYYNDCGLGLFGAVEEATIKNLTVDGAEISGESAISSTIAAVAHNTTFENINVKNAKVADYQYYAGGIVGWASGDINVIGCNIDETTAVGAQWGEFNNANGGVIGGASSNAKIFIKDCVIACRIDAFNDVVSAYEWYSYRRSGMIIGDTGHVDDPDGDNVGYALAPQLTCENVTVIYGEWANYHYCQFGAMAYPWVRVEEGTSTGAYSNPRYGNPTDADGNTVTDDNHTHNDGEKHHELIVFDQLYGGESGHRYCTYGTATHEGVTVIYNNK